MKPYILKLIMGAGWAFIACVCTALLWHTIFSGLYDKLYFRSIPEIRVAETLTQIQNVEATGKVFRGFLYGGLVLFISAGFGVPYGMLYAHIRKSRVHTIELGNDHVPVLDTDLSIAAPLAMGIVSARQIEATDAGAERGIQQAIATYQQMAALSGKVVEKRTAAISLPENVQEQQNLVVPSFSDLLRSGDLAPGQEMILGFEHGVPRRGSFLDIYSAAVAGESGSGKTSTLLFLIGSAIVSMPVNVFAIDPHYPHPKSFGYKIDPLAEAGLIQMATYKDDMLDMLKHVEKIIENRLRQHDTDDTPVVLVIDELAFLSTTSIGSDVSRTMERISMEGRKCAVYMLASSQTWLTAKTGGSSSVRDTLTSAYVHRIKPRQANLLLQDKDEADKVRKHVKQAGEALLIPVGEESSVVKMPYTDKADMEAIVKLMGTRQVDHQPKTLEVSPTFDPGLVTMDMIRDFLADRKAKDPDYSQNKLAQELNISKGYMSKLFNGTPLTDDIRRQFLQIHC